jgi:hypothetical protein
MNKRKKQCQRIAAITKCPLHPALYILNQGAYREPVLCLRAWTVATECSTFMCFDLRYGQKLLSHSHTAQHGVTELLCSQEGVSMHHESRIFQRKGNMVDLILIMIAEIYVPTQRPDTNCAILINAVSLCKLQSELVQAASCCGLCRRKKCYISLLSAAAV